MSLVVEIAVALGVSTAMLVLLHRLAPRLGLMDEPSGRRKTHRHAVAPVGGIAIFAALLIALIVHGNPSVELGYGLLGAAVLVIVGVLDDRFDLGYRLRFLAQIVAASILTLGADIQLFSLGDLLGLGPVELGMIAVPLTVFAIVGLINAFNMVDGIDGLAGGLALIALSGTLILLPPGADVMAFVLPALIAAIIPYLAFNLEAPGFRGRKVFLGDAGSLLLGYMVAWALINTSQSGGNLTPVTALWLAAVPLLDTFSVMGRRLIQGRSPFTADHGHLHHRLLRLTGSARTALVIILSVAAACALLGVLASEHQVSEPQLFALAWVTFGAYALLQRGLPSAYRWLRRRRRKLASTDAMGRRLGGNEP
jgi:UDP-GlcNAc:undecaprenyl-phosphate GlcNAc-1-phosphate transferase